MRQRETAILTWLSTLTWLCATSPSPLDRDQVDIKNRKKNLLTSIYDQKKIAVPAPEILSVVCPKFFFFFFSNQLWKKFFTVFDTDRGILHTLKQYICSMLALSEPSYIRAWASWRHSGEQTLSRTSFAWRRCSWPPASCRSRLCVCIVNYEKQITDEKLNGLWAWIFWSTLVLLIEKRILFGFPPLKSSCINVLLSL